jgi:predicted site-specific integrase-resolvase
MTTTVEVPKLLRAHEVCGLFGVCHETLRNWVKAGRFPAPVPVTGGQGRKRYWRAEDVRKVLAEM